MKKHLLLLIIVFISARSQVNNFDSMDEKTTVSTGIHKLSLKEKTALIEWLKKVHLQSKTEIKQQARLEVTSEIKQEIRAEVKKEVKEELRQEVKEEVAKTERKKFMGFSMKESNREIIKSSIMGEFVGWNGKTLFKLENGQVWKQSNKAKYQLPKKFNPGITIKPKSMNSWTLYIDGYNKGVKVKRIK